MNQTEPVVPGSDASGPPDTMDLLHNDVEIRVFRRAGKWSVEYVGFPMPKDVHQAQKAINDSYRMQRRRLAKAYNQVLQKFKTTQREAKEAERRLVTANRDAEALEAKTKSQTKGLANARRS